MLEFLQKFMGCYGFLLAYLWNYCRNLWDVGIVAGMYGIFWVFDGIFMELLQGFMECWSFLPEFVVCFGCLMAYLWNYCSIYGVIAGNFWNVGVFAGIYGMFWIFDGIFMELLWGFWNVGIFVGIYGMFWIFYGIFMELLSEFMESRSFCRNLCDVLDFWWHIYGIFARIYGMSEFLQ